MKTGPRLRQATTGDMLLYFEWANDPEVRSRSFDSRPILIADHRAWFEKKLKSSNVFMLVLEDEGPVGQIRFDVANDVALIGFSLASHARGRGLGSYLLRNGCARLHAAFPEVRIARGLVKADNIASCRAFESTGFHIAGETLEAGVASRAYELELASVAISTEPD